MFGNSRFARVHQLFGDQFQPDGRSFLYRKGMKGPPVRVSEAERDEFVSAFKRRLRYATWILTAATVLLIGLLVLLVPDVHSPAANVALYAGLAVVMVPYLLAFYWAWNAPARALERRSPAGAALTREEARQLMFAKMTYRQLGLAVVGAALLVWSASAKGDVFHGWGVLWLVFAGFIVAAAMVQAIRKWRYERR